jgi:hypothetical protein
MLDQPRTLLLRWSPSRKGGFWYKRRRPHTGLTDDTYRSDRLELRRSEASVRDQIVFVCNEEGSLNSCCDRPLCVLHPAVPYSGLAGAGIGYNATPDFLYPCTGRYDGIRFSASRCRRTSIPLRQIESSVHFSARSCGQSNESKV